MIKSQPMAIWAVIESGGKQYKVSEGETVNVDKLNLNSQSDTVVFNEVLAVGNGKDVKIGKPYVDKAKVKSKVLETFKDKKIRVVKFKSKSRYLRTRGHRQQKTKILIEKIES